MAIIDQYRGILTVLIEIDVAPEEIEETIKELKEFTLNYVKQCPGFISANLHRSLNSQKIINYAQWKTEESFQNFLNSPDTQKKMKELKLKETQFTLMKVVLAT